MNIPHHIKTFQSGNSIAVRLPKALGFGLDETYQIIRHGDQFVGRRVPTPDEEAERLGRFREGLAALKALGQSPSVQAREPIEFPERPGL